MIKITRLDGRELTINSDLIESIEATPDTIISLTTSKKLLVREPVNVLVRRITRYKRSVWRYRDNGCQTPIVDEGT